MMTQMVLENGRKNKATKKGRESKLEVLAAKPGEVIIVSFDTHKKTYHPAVWKNGVLAASWVMPADNAAVVRMLEPAREALVKVVYEAGPTGYSLARALEAAGFPVGVVAPGKTPHAPNQGNKSDRIDCRQLAVLAAKKMLTFVTPPSAQEEQERQVLRVRESLMTKRRRVMQQLKSMLLQYGIAEPEGLNKWTRAGVAALRQLELAEDLRFCFDELLSEFAYFNQALKRARKKLAVIAKRHASEMARLRSHPGVGEKTARHFLLEIHQPRRFDNHKQLAAYLGLAPKVRQSGETRREGGVLRSGRGGLRATLVEACWRWVRDDAEARRTYGRLCRNTGCPQKAIYALARRMAVNLWCMLTREQSYRPAVKVSAMAPRPLRAAAAARLRRAAAAPILAPPPIRPKLGLG